MIIMGIDPGKTGAIFLYNTQPCYTEREQAQRWFPHIYEFKPYLAIKIPLIWPPSILTRKLDAKGKRKRKQPKASIDFEELARLLNEVIRTYKPDAVFIERVTGSVSSGPQAGSFSFGTTYGYLRGVVAGNGIKPTLVGPSVWKAAVGIVSAAGQVEKKKAGKVKKVAGKKAAKVVVKATEDKDVARKLASKLFPMAAHEWLLAKEDGVAEAALICQYGIIQTGADL